MKDHFPWNETPDQVVSGFSSSLETGLSEGEASKRWHQYGPNKLQTRPAKGWFSIVLAQFRSLLVLL